MKTLIAGKKRKEGKRKKKKKARKRRSKREEIDERIFYLVLTLEFKLVLRLFEGSRICDGGKIH